MIYDSLILGAPVFVKLVIREVNREVPGSDLDWCYMPGFQDAWNEFDTLTIRTATIGCDP